MLDGSRTDLAAILLTKFRQGMDTEVMMQITCSGSSQPANNNLFGWFSSAQRLARADDENQAFLNASWGPLLPLNHMYASVPNHNATYAPPAGPPPLPAYCAPSLVLPPSKPMDIGHAWRCGTPGLGCPGSQNMCYMCGKVSHFLCKCSDKPEYHVRALMEGNIKEIMQDFAANKI